MRYFFRELPVAIADLPVLAKALLAFIAAIVVVFLTLSPRSDYMFEVSPSQNAADATRAVSHTIEPVQTETGVIPDAVQPQSSAVVTIRLERPEVRPNGLIRKGETYILLFGITRFTAKDVCTKSSAQKWACGLQAYATLHNLIAGHAIECLPRELEGKNIVASCRLDSHNLAAELLMKGLVKLQPDVSDSELQQAESYARSKRIGVWE